MPIRFPQLNQFNLGTQTVLMRKGHRLTRVGDAAISDPSRLRSPNTISAGRFRTARSARRSTACRHGAVTGTICSIMGLEIVSMIRS